MHVKSTTIPHLERKPPASISKGADNIDNVMNTAGIRHTMYIAIRRFIVGYMGLYGGGSSRCACFFPATAAVIVPAIIATIMPITAIDAKTIMT